MHDTYEARSKLRQVPEGYTEVEGTRSLSRPIEAQLQIETATFERPIRIAEPGALVIGQHRRSVLLSDPGERVLFACAGLVVNRFDAPWCLTFHDSEFKLGAVTKGQELEQGGWSRVLDDRRRGRALAGPEIFGALAEAEARGFNRAEIVTAFGSGEALDVVRAAAVDRVRAHLDGLAGRALLDFYRGAAACELVPEFTSADVGAVAESIFLEELAAAVEFLELLDVLELLDELVSS